MTWDQLLKSQSKEYKWLLIEYKIAADQLAADKKMLLGTHSETAAPENIRDKIIRDREAFRAEWAMDGRRFLALRVAHEKEINAFLQESDQ